MDTIRKALPNLGTADRVFLKSSSSPSCCLILNFLLNQVKVEAQFCRPRNPRTRWNVKGNHDTCSREKSTHDLGFSHLPPEVDRTPARIPKHIAEISVSPTRDCRVKRPHGLSDRDQVLSVSKRPRRTVFFHWSHRRMLQGFLLSVSI